MGWSFSRICAKTSRRSQFSARAESIRHVGTALAVWAGAFTPEGHHAPPRLPCFCSHPRVRRFGCSAWSHPARSCCRPGLGLGRGHRTDHRRHHGPGRVHRTRRVDRATAWCHRLRSARALRRKRLLELTLHREEHRSPRLPWIGPRSPQCLNGGAPLSGGGFYFLGLRVSKNEKTPHKVGSVSTDG